MRYRFTWITDFLESEHGGVETISLVLWLPFVVSFFVMVADFSFIMFNRSNLVRIAEDSTRLRSIGALLSDLQTEQHIASRLAIVGPAAIDTRVSQGVVRTDISIPISAIDAFGIFSRISNDAALVVRVSQFKEDPEA